MGPAAAGLQPGAGKSGQRPAEGVLHRYHHLAGYTAAPGHGPDERGVRWCDDRPELFAGSAGGCHCLHLPAGHQGAVCRLRPEGDLRAVSRQLCAVGPAGHPQGGQHLLRLCPGKAAGLPDHRNPLLHLLQPFQVPVYAAGLCDRGRDQCDPLLRALFGRHPQHLFDPAGLSHPGGVFCPLRAGTPAAGRQHHRPVDPGGQDRPFQPVGDRGHFGGRQLFRRAWDVFWRAGICVLLQRGQFLSGYAAAAQRPAPGHQGLYHRLSESGTQSAAAGEKFVNPLAIKRYIVYNTALRGSSLEK